jgi:hypothetical protein
VLRSAPPGQADTFVQLAQAPDGSLQASFAELPLSELVNPNQRPQRERVLVTRSADGGRSWSNAVSLGSAAYGVPALAAGPGGVMVAWVQSGRPDQVSAYLSRDAGSRFRPAPNLGADGAIRAPALAAGRDGSFVLLALTERHPGAGGVRRARASISWLGRGGARWESTAISEPFSLEDRDFLGRAAAAGLYTTGLAPMDGSFLAVFPVGAPLAMAGPSDIAAERVQITVGPRAR